MEKRKNEPSKLQQKGDYHYDFMYVVKDCNEQCFHHEQLNRKYQKAQLTKKKKSYKTTLQMTVNSTISRLTFVTVALPYELYIFFIWRSFSPKIEKKWTGLWSVREEETRKKRLNMMHLTCSIFVPPPLLLFQIVFFLL